MPILREIEAVRKNAGIWMRDDYTVVQFTGKDAGAWLHAQTSNDVVGLRSGQGNMQAILDRQGRVQAFFSLHRWEDEFWAIIEKAQFPALMARVESHLFLEDVAVEEVGADTPQILLEGPRTVVLLANQHEDPLEAARHLPTALHAFAPIRIFDHEVLVFRQTESGEDGFLLLPAPGEAESLYQKIEDAGYDFFLMPVGPEARDTLILESGMPRWNGGIDGECIIAETPLADCAVSYEKGCYLGQEVVARLKAYGSPKQRLVALLVDDDGAPMPPPGAILRDGDRKAGRAARGGFSPTLNAWLLHAYLDRDHRTSGARYTLQPEGGDAPIRGVLAHLPAWQPPSRRENAQRYYDEALGHFEADARDEDDTAIQILMEVLLLAPDFEDAYEALGVILHRHHRVEEAIRFMKKLAELNPNCVMAHTNLSVFYMTQGRIQEAEDEKAIAHQLEFKQQLDARQAEKAAQAERARIQAEAEQRIGMFLEVLEIDPEDPVATMGLGQAYIQLDRHADAIPHLETATRVQKDFSAAYLNLGKCHEVLGNTEAAREAYKTGIEVAGRKGDLMPMREMERRLKQLG
ncbi:MAG: tetratricopeptide repeat protein [Candidatus Hydrogenedentes bacterium]|nr:tetratricopeptide repeat protein [Candidatus Hydrogenedentota bacterium]